MGRGKFPASMSMLKKAKCWCGEKKLVSVPARRGALRAPGLVEPEALEWKSRAEASEISSREQGDVQIKMMLKSKSSRLDMREGKVFWHRPRSCLP